MREPAASERAAVHPSRVTRNSVSVSGYAGEDARMRLVLEMVDMGAVTGWCEQKHRPVPLCETGHPPYPPSLFARSPAFGM